MREWIQYPHLYEKHLHFHCSFNNSHIVSSSFFWFLLHPGSSFLLAHSSRFIHTSICPSAATLHLGPSSSITYPQHLYRLLFFKSVTFCSLQLSPLFFNIYKPSHNSWAKTFLSTTISESILETWFFVCHATDCHCFNRKQSAQFYYDFLTISQFFSSNKILSFYDSVSVSLYIIISDIHYGYACGGLYFLPIQIAQHSAVCTIPFPWCSTEMRFSNTSRNVVCSSITFHHIASAQNTIMHTSLRTSVLPPRQLPNALAEKWKLPGLSALTT